MTRTRRNDDGRGTTGTNDDRDGHDAGNREDTRRTTTGGWQDQNAAANWTGDNNTQGRYTVQWGKQAQET